VVLAAVLFAPPPGIGGSAAGAPIDGAARASATTTTEQSAGGPRLAALLADHSEHAPVLIAAHRGLWRSAPENSMPAITKAIGAGAHIVEIDVKRTKDGVLVLMHDDSVDRTTNGTGNVSDLTFAQIEQLRLREGLGGQSTAITTERVPTLEAALLATRNKSMINLDKGWPYRDQMYDLAVSTGTLATAIFKSSAPVAEVAAFRAKDAGIVYSHVVDDANASSLTEFGDHPPVAYELIFDRLTDPQIQPAAVAAAATTSRIWINTMWIGLAADFTDERSLIDLDDGWRSITDRFRANIIQTDNVAELVHHLDGKDVTAVADPSRSFRVQSEAYSTLGKEIGYHDSDDSNNGNAARAYEGVDICSQQGAVAVCYTRAGEWLRYDITVERPGNYRVSARAATNAPTGTVQVDYGNGRLSEIVAVRNTTSHDAFELQTLDRIRALKTGAQSFWVRLGSSGVQNFNLDYLQFDRL
jgi:glycerophosphoryl diester phosphodiesterase